MKKVLVIGSGGAGKSTFAARLAAKTGLPLLHLDALFWHPGWVETPKDEWLRTVERLTADEAWLMDGNFGGTLELRLAACDTVIFLDLPRTLCLWRVLMRRLRFHGESRPDMSPGCPERLSWEFLSWIWTYPSVGARRSWRAWRPSEARRPSWCFVRARRSRSSWRAESQLARLRSSLHASLSRRVSSVASAWSFGPSCATLSGWYWVMREM